MPFDFNIYAMDYFWIEKMTTAPKTPFKMKPFL